LTSRDIDIDHITRRKPPRSRDAMGDFLVHADAGGAGKPIDRLRGRHRACGVQHAAADAIAWVIACSVLATMRPMA
jgi:hypothetical protein